MSRLSVAEISRLVGLLVDDEDERDGDHAPIHGIEIDVWDRRFRGLLRAVLDHLADRFPEDLARIRCRVSHIAYFGSAEARPGISASYGDKVQGAPEHLAGPDGILRPAAWPIRVSRSLIEGGRKFLVAVIVHELGHAASTPDDVEVRSGLGSEWGAELAADYHAARWGFGRLITSMRPKRSVAHHGPVPGEKVIVRFGENRVDWLVRDDRVLKCEGPTL